MLFKRRWSFVIVQEFKQYLTKFAIIVPVYGQYFFWVLANVL